MPANHPTQVLTIEHLVKIKAAIVDKIDPNNPSPQLNNATNRTGWILICCYNAETREWLKKIEIALKPWQKAELKAAEGEEIPRPVICVTNITRGNEVPREKFLPRLA